LCADRATTVVGSGNVSIRPRIVEVPLAGVVLGHRGCVPLAANKNAKTEGSMIISLRLILMILGFLCLFLAALQIGAPRVNLQALGLSLWLLAEMLSIK
jgi:hypothetical protein